MKPNTPRPVRLALENAVYPILAHLVSLEGAESVANGLTAVAHAGHRMERRLQDRRERGIRRGVRSARAGTQEARGAELLADPRALTDAEIFEIRQRHELVALGSRNEAAAAARADRAALLRENDRLRIEMVRAHEELNALRSQLALMDEDALDRDLADLRARADANFRSDGGDGADDALPPEPWADGGVHPWDRSDTTCAACAFFEGRAALRKAG